MTRASRLAGRILAPAAFAAALAAASCGGDETATGSTSGGGHGGGGGSVEKPHDWTECQASAQAFARRAVLALAGRRPLGQVEVNAFEDAIQAVDAADGATAPATPDGADLPASRRVLARALMAEGPFRTRWSEYFMDALHVNRREIKDQESCYGRPRTRAVDDGGLARWVRDNAPTATGAPMRHFVMEDLLSSAIELDDLSVVYRANLFAMMSRPITGANVDFLEMERIRRQDFGAVFDSAYLHRDVVCLSCHNSEFSVTFDPDPAKNRSWPVPGLFEKALFGSSDGKHPPDPHDELNDDFLRAHSMLRVSGVVEEFPGDPAAVRPWGMKSSCGEFRIPTRDDPLGVDTYFGSIRRTADAPKRGARASVWDLEESLHRGVDLLAAHGLRRESSGDLADPDEAFAYLVAENLVEGVWNEVMGAKLTIANYIPRTQVQRDVLMALTEHFVATHFSLKTLLLDILAHSAFNLKAPDEGCGNSAYELPNVFDPWVVGDTDVEKRGNSPGDGIFAISARPLTRSLGLALGWPDLPDYPRRSADETFQVAIGMFEKDAEPGFRGFDFQGRLSWEQAYGDCAKQGGADFVSELARTAVHENATLEDAVVALKDRLIGEPAIDPDEVHDLQALLGAKLAEAAPADVEDRLRRLCGVLVSTPQFLLGGMPAKDTRVVPKLGPKDVTYLSACREVRRAIDAAGEPYQLHCHEGSATAERKP